MATEVKLPRLGQGMESGTIVRWLKKEGEPVEKREPLYELDTDKVTQEVEAEADGVLLKIVVDSGEVEVGRTIAFIGAEGEDVPSGNGGAPAETESTADDATEAEPQVQEEGSPAEEMDDERGRIDMEVRRAERRLHDIASRSFESMLAEARSDKHVS